MIRMATVSRCNASPPRGEPPVDRCRGRGPTPSPRAEPVTRIIYDRLNRRKIDSYPIGMDDPPKARIRELIGDERTDPRRRTRTIGEVICLVTEVAEVRLRNPRYERWQVRGGGPDKSDSMRWLMDHVACTRGMPQRCLIRGRVRSGG
jgi:hypothetical protein